jgi:hypothetical protein
MYICIISNGLGLGFNPFTRTRFLLIFPRASCPSTSARVTASRRRRSRAGNRPIATAGVSRGPVVLPRERSRLPPTPDCDSALRRRLEPAPPRRNPACAAVMSVIAPTPTLSATVLPTSSLSLFGCSLSPAAAGESPPPRRKSTVLGGGRHRGDPYRLLLP